MTKIFIITEKMAQGCQDMSHSTGKAYQSAKNIVSL